MVSTSRATTGRGTVRSGHRRVELWLHPRGTVPQETALPGQPGTRTAGNDFPVMWHTDARRLAKRDQAAAVPHAEGQETVPTEDSGGFRLLTCVVFGAVGQNAGAGSGQADNGRSSAQFGVAQKCRA